MKIAVFGAGSTYTPELMEGFFEFQHKLKIRELHFVDPDKSRLKILADMSRRMVAKAGLDIKIIESKSQRSAVEGAKFVLTQFRVGGQQARHRDIMLGKKYGVVGQETVGVGGFAKAMRTVPVILDICKDIRKYAPRAKMVNFTNPSSIVTEAINRYGGVKAVGLCNVPIGMQKGIANRLKVPVNEVKLDYVGLNHFSFIRKVTVRGKDVTARVLRDFNKIPKARNIKVVQYEQKFLDALGMVPNSYLQYYYLPDEMISKIAKARLTRAQEVMKVEATLLKMFKDPKLDYKPKELELRGGADYSTTAVALITALNSDKPTRHICNVVNNGALPDLPDYNVVEVPAMVSKHGVKSVKMGRMDAKIRGMVAQVKAYEELTVEAAVHMRYDMALMALANNPLVPSATLARGILDDLIKINKLKLK